MKRKSLTESQKEINEKFASIFRQQREMLNTMNKYSAKSYRLQVECEELERKKKNLENDIKLLTNSTLNKNA